MDDSQFESKHSQNERSTTCFEVYRSSVNEVNDHGGGVHVQLRLTLLKNLKRKYEVDPPPHTPLMMGKCKLIRKILFFLYHYNKS